MNWRYAIMLLAVGILVSCAGSPHSADRPAATATARVWPAPPDAPRIVFRQCLHGPADIGVRPAFFHSLASWLTGENGESLRLRKPFAVALDETGNLCITDTDANLLCYCDFTRKRWQQFAGAGAFKFASPVAVARRHGVFYVADSRLDRVLALTDAGSLVFALGAPLQRPVALAIVGERLYVVDALAHAVLVFGLDGKYQFRFGGRGTGPGEFNYPTAIGEGAGGQLLVSDTLNSRVQVFDRDGHFLATFGSNGDTSGHFARPKGVAVDAAGHIYVVDAVFDNFQIFDPAGRLLLNVGESGNQPGSFALPSGIAIGADNRIFVADSFNHRVQVFQYTGEP